MLESGRRPSKRWIPGSPPWMRTPPATRLTMAGIQSPRGALATPDGRHDCSQGAESREPGCSLHSRASREMAQWIRAPVPWPDSMFPGALLRHGCIRGAARVREHCCRRRLHARASRENGRMDADTRFQPLLLPRKSPNLSNNQRVWRGPIAGFYSKTSWSNTFDIIIRPP
jgi:hypothetical protein